MPKNSAAAESGREYRAQRFRRSLSNAEIISDDSAVRMMKRSRRKKLGQLVFYIFAAAAMCLIFAIACSSIFFRISAVNVSGTLRYSAEEIAEGSGAVLGASLYSVSESSVNRLLTHTFPYISSVELTRTLPDEINLRLTEEEPRWFIEICGEYFVLSRELRILERSSDCAALRAREELTELDVYPVKKAIVGETIVFESDSYFKFLQSFLTSLEISELYASGHIVYADLSNKFNVSLIWAERGETIVPRFRLIIGSNERLDVKLVIANAIITQYYAGGNELAEINVESEPSFAIALRELDY